MESAKHFEELKLEAEPLLQGVGQFLAELVEAGGDGSAASSASDAQVGESFRQYSLLRQRHREQHLTVAVLALTKSGKSTLLNALIGDTILPSTNVPETARISTIQHVPLGPQDHPTLAYTDSKGARRVVESAPRIYDTLRVLNQEKRGRNHRFSDEALLEIKTRIAALEGVGVDPKEVTLKLLDTPGPNEAGEEALKFQVERLLESVDAVVYLLDYTKLKTQEEADLLRKLRDINPRLFERLSQRLFFCVNKADAIETTEGMEAEDTRHYVADLITRQLQQDTFQLKPEQVLLVSARDALLARLVQRNRATTNESTMFRKLAFGRKPTEKSRDEMLEAADSMFHESGLATLESMIFTYLYSHSAPLKLLAIVDDCARLLQQVQNVAMASQASLRADMATLQQKISTLQYELAGVLGEFKALQAEAELIEGSVVDEVQTRMQTLKEKLFHHVTAVLEADEDSPSSSLVRTGRWKAVWDKAMRFLARQDDPVSNAHAADLQTTLAELHQDIQDQISAEVADFWHEVELATNVRQQSMFLAVNMHLERLSKAVNMAVGDLLSLRMEPVLVRMEPPSAVEFHNSLQELFEKGIGKVEETKVRERQEDYVKWEKRYRGLCHNEYYVGTPSTRTIMENYSETSYRLEPAKIKSYFMSQVEGRVAASTTYIRAFVHQYVAGRINEARKNIEAYANRYSETMEAALNTQREGEATRLRAVAAVEAQLTHIADLLTQSDRLSGRLDSLLEASELPVGTPPAERAVAGSLSGHEAGDAQAVHTDAAGSGAGLLLSPALTSFEAPMQVREMPALIAQSPSSSSLSSSSSEASTASFSTITGEYEMTAHVDGTVAPPVHAAATPIQPLDSTPPVEEQPLLSVGPMADSRAPGSSANAPRELSTPVATNASAAAGEDAEFSSSKASSSDSSSSESSSATSDDTSDESEGTRDEPPTLIAPSSDEDDEPPTLVHSSDEDTDEDDEPTHPFIDADLASNAPLAAPLHSSPLDQMIDSDARPSQATRPDLEALVSSSDDEPPLLVHSSGSGSLAAAGDTAFALHSIQGGAQDSTQLPAGTIPSVTEQAIDRLQELLGLMDTNQGAEHEAGGEMGPAGYASAFSTFNDGSADASPRSVSPEGYSSAVLPAEFVQMDTHTPAAGTPVAPQAPLEKSSSSDEWTVLESEDDTVPTL